MLSSEEYCCKNGKDRLIFISSRRKYLRVLLVKRPDMMVPTFFAQYQFVCNIKSTYQVDMPGTKNFDVGANTVPWGVILVLGPRQK